MLFLSHKIAIEERMDMPEETNMLRDDKPEANYA